MPSTSVISTQSLPVSYYLRPTRMLQTCWQHRDLIRQLTWRNVLARYRGSTLGLTWSFLLPLMMLAVYTFVFGGVFQSRWPKSTDQSVVTFALTLYAGLLVYVLFSETLNAAPSLILSNPNYVKKVVFPLEILPLCSLGAAVIHFLIGVLALLLCALAFSHRISSTLYCFPLALVPLMMFTLGLAWFLASLGVYLRDVGQFIGIVLQMLMFLSPVFYSLEQVPPGFRTAMQLNPLTPAVEIARQTLLWGQYPDWLALAVLFVVGGVTMQLGYVWFMKTRRGFADVL